MSKRSKKRKTTITQMKHTTHTHSIAIVVAKTKLQELTNRPTIQIGSTQYVRRYVPIEVYRWCVTYDFLSLSVKRCQNKNWNITNMRAMKKLTCSHTQIVSNRFDCEHLITPSSVRAHSYHVSSPLISIGLPHTNKLLTNLILIRLFRK